MTKSITLKVAEAYHRDVGRGTARFSQDLMTGMGVKNDDVVEIQGKISICAVAQPTQSSDHSDIIRIDGNLRSKLGVEVDDKVVVKKTEVRPAKRVTMAPSKRIQLVGGPQYLLRNRLGRPIVKGERLRVEMISSSLGFVVVSTTPRGPVVVTTDTNLKILEEPLDELSVREVAYEDIGGLAKEIRMVREMIELPLRHPELFQKLGINPPTCVLLHGPPGTGKTLIARAVASKTDANFISVKGPELISKWVGECKSPITKVTGI